LRAIAPVDQFYITSSHGEPAVDVNKWSLTIDGLVTSRCISIMTIFESWRPMKRRSRWNAFRMKLRAG
jgi:hypothetical protein